MKHSSIFQLSGIVFFVVLSLGFFVDISAGSLQLESAVYPDEYEEDDSWSQANVIVLNQDTPQLHNFHDEGDQDWVKFYGIENQTYTIEVNNPGPDADTVIELYGSDGTTLIYPNDDTIAGEEEYFDFKCTADAVYYVKVRNYDPGIFGENTYYELQVYRCIAPAFGVITGEITDRDTGEPIENAAVSTELGGSALSDRGFYMLVHPAGTFMLSVGAEGYSNFTVSVTLEAGKAVTKNIPMTPTGSDNGSPCVAESVYGEHSEQAALLRCFRDTVIIKTAGGKEIIRCYYQWSPSIVQIMQKNKYIRQKIKTVLDTMLPVIRAKLK